MAVTPESFIELLEKSKLLGAEQLAAARNLAGEIDVKDPRELAKALVLKHMLTRWQAAKLLAGRSSFFMGKYKLIDQIGRGGMGGVFLVEHTMMNRTAALKVISRKLGKDPALLERFLTEARAIAALDHANIAHAYDVDKEGERYYLVMEYIEGHDLQRMVEEDGPLDLAKAVDYIRQAADGLAHAHGKNMIHCDIKPANLLVNRQGVVKILDMGMARLVGDGGDGSDADERVLGTVDYMAPEQAMDSPNLDHRVDIYSLGCTLYYLLTGQPPFPKGAIHERIVKHQTQEPRAVEKLRADAPKDLVEICRKMMAKDPADRYQTAEEVSRVLGDWRPPPSPKIKRALPLESADDADAEPEEEKTAKVRPVARRGKKGVKVPPLLEKLKPAVEKAKVLLSDRRRATWAGGIGLVVIFLIVGLVWALGRKSPSSDEAVAASQGASADAKSAKPADDSATGVKQDKKDGEKSDAAAKKTAEAETKPTASEKGAKAETAKASGDKPPAEKAAKDAPKSSDKSEGKTTEKPADKSATKPADKGAEKPKTDAKTEKAGEKKADKAKTEPKAEPAKPKPPAPPPDPFKDFPTAVDLPADGGELGKIHTAASVAWELDLENGDKVLKGNRQFTKPESKDEGGKPVWVVQLSTPGVGKDKEATLTDVAKFSREGESLHFQWGEGVPAALAGNLRLCRLKIRAGGSERSLALVKSATVEPLMLNLDRVTTATKVSIPWIPDPTKTRVQIVKVDGVKDYTVSPQDPVPLKKKIVISFIQKDARTKVEQAGLELACTASGMSKVVTFNVQVPRNLFSVPLKTLQDPSVQREFLKTFPPSIARDPPLVEFFKFAADEPDFRIKLGQELQKWNTSLEKPGKDQKVVEMKVEAAGRLVWLIDLYTASKAAKIHFRVLAEVGDQQVEIATTGATAEAKK